MKKTTINTDQMLDYLKSFNYIEKKYKIDSKNPDLIIKLKNREMLEQAGKLKKIPPSYIAHGVKTLYNLDAECQNDSMVIFDCVYEKIINEFLAIPGLETLFDENFYDFEWDMHMEYDFSELSHSFYRDHVEHQVRNMYMILEMLDTYHFMDALKSFHMDPSLNKIANFVYIKQRTFIERQYISPHDQELLKECAQLFFSNQFDKICDEQLDNNDYVNGVDYKKCLDVWNKYKIISGMYRENALCQNLDKRFNDCIQHLDQNQSSSNESDNRIAVSTLKKAVYGIIKACFNTEENLICSQKSADATILFDIYIQQYSIEYIIRSACIICALFHDISYPLCHFNTIRRRVSNYMPSMNMFINNRGADVDRVISILKPSLLLNVVAEQEIRKQLVCNDEKWDHGVYSAIALLLTFYESGRINQLSADKQAAIEVAAVAIYNHNFKYNIVPMSDGDNSQKLIYYHPIFSLNPISFLLKLCDDLQEWDRKYFEFSTKEPIMFCPNCFLPVIHGKYYNITQENVKKPLGEEIMMRDKYRLVEHIFCSCTNDYKKMAFFPSRNMYTVTVCDNLTVNAIVQNNEKYNLIIQLDYDPLKLLYMSTISSKYSFFRQKELHSLKILLQNQHYYTEDDIFKYDNIYIDYTMTCNPLYLKSTIIANAVFQDKSKDNSGRTQGVYNDFFALLMQIEKKENTSDIADTIKKKIVPFLSKTTINGTDTSDSIFDVIPQICSVLSTVLSKGSEFASKHQLSQEAMHSIYKKLMHSIIDFIRLDKFPEAKQELKNKIFTLFPTRFKGKLNFFLKSIDEKLNIYLDIAFMLTFNKKGIVLTSAEDYKKELLSLPRFFDDERFDFKQIIHILVDDCCELLFTKPNVFGPYYDSFQDDYYSFCRNQKSDTLYDAVDKYCTSMNWYKNGKNDNNHSSYKEFSRDNLDYYSDLFLFEILGRKCEAN